uniref:Uncharacterized protein n=1 Tax=Tanacetum cinerariifolium TaxID=118510 RepID=A0A6L2M814_TANCI|nr:hypothetical protein [Tanacetum cinerariifolium]
MAQQVIPAAQLFPKFQGIRRYVPAVYLQQFWKIVHKVPDTKDTMRFKLDTQEITYTMDMFRDTLKLPVETPDNPFVTPITIKTIESLMQTVGYEGVVDKKKNVIQYHQFIKLIIVDLIEKYPSIPRRHDEDYHSIKDDTLLKYEPVLFEVDILMNQPQPVVPKEHIGLHLDPIGYLPLLLLVLRGRRGSKVMIKSDEMAEATILSLTLHTTALTAKAQKNITKVQEKLDKEEIKGMVEGEEDEESYASEFANSMLNNNVDDSGTRIEPGSHKEHPENVNDDVEEIAKEKKDDETEKENEDDDVEKTDEVVREKDNDEVSMGSMEFRNKKIQTPIPTPTRSPRKDLSSDKIISKELTTTVSLTTATTSKDSSIHKKRSISYKTQILLGSIVGMCRRHGQFRSHINNKFVTHELFMGKIREVLDHYNMVVPKMTFAKTNEMIKEEMPHLVNLAVKKDCEVDPINVPKLISKKFATHGPKMIEELFKKHIQNTTLNFYPTTSSSTAKKSTVDLQQQLYLNMKTKPQDQAADLKLWEILKANF